MYISKDKIIIDKKNFCAKHIFECGQVFCYKKINDEHYIIYSEDKKAEVVELDNKVEIITKDIDYFINYFDLYTDYEIIKQTIKKNHFVIDAVNYGYGIRILNQSILETIIGFVISANNNIKRIQKSMFSLREKLGNNVGDYFSFPTLQQLENADEKFFTEIGTGYRAKYLVKIIRELKQIDLNSLHNLSTNELKNKLISLSGVGPKVADCIMLFCLQKRDVFPVDTWIEKVYNDYFDKETNRLKIRENLIGIFKEYSGYAQQYLFYYKREKNI